MGLGSNMAVASAPPEESEELRQRVVEAVDDALLEGDDRVVRDRDVLGADLGAALGDVAVADAHPVLDEREAVLDVERVHLEARDAHEEARARELGLLRVVAEDVAHVLAQEALDALPELLD